MPGLIRVFLRSYGRGMETVQAQALERFASVYKEAESLEKDASIMSLATATAEGRPSVRIVNFSGLVDDSFAFFANAESGKGVQLQANPQAALCFYWPVFGYQVVIDGDTRKLSVDDADDLWRARPRSSTLMAWASQQSAESGDLDERLRAARGQFDYKRVPRPEYWIAYGLRACRIELWPSGWHRRREREAYVETDDGWQRTTLNP